MSLDYLIIQTVSLFAHLFHILAILWRLLVSVFGSVSRTSRGRQRRHETDVAEEPRTAVEHLDLEAARSVQETKQCSDVKEGAGKDVVEQKSVYVPVEEEKTSPYSSHPMASEHQHILPIFYTPSDVRSHTPPQSEPSSVHNRSPYQSYDAIALSSINRNSPPKSITSIGIDTMLDDAFSVHDSGYCNDKEEIGEQQSSFAKGVQYSITQNFRFPPRRTKAEKWYYRRTMPDYLFSKTDREPDDVFANHDPLTSSISAPSICSNIINIRRRPNIRNSYFSPDISPPTSPSCYSCSSWNSRKSDGHSGSTNVLPAWRSNPDKALFMFGQIINDEARDSQKQPDDPADQPELNSFEKMMYELGVVVENGEGEGNVLSNDDALEEVDSFEMEHRRFAVLDNALSRGECV